MKSFARFLLTVAVCLVSQLLNPNALAQDVGVQSTQTAGGIRVQPAKAELTEIQSKLEELQIKNSENRIFTTSVEVQDRISVAGQNEAALAIHDQKEAAKLLSETKKDIEYLNKTSAEKTRSQEYERSLEANSELLDRIGREADDLKKLSLLKALARDAELKVAYEKKANTTAEDLVKISVSTKRGNQEESGYEVWYVHYGWADTPSKYQRFGQNSSPTNKKLVPGYYYMWSQDPNNPARQGPKKPVDVGDDGEPEQRVDIPTP